MTSSERCIVVVGGGITGLAAAHRLRTSSSARVVLIEPADRLGGKLRTERVDGFVVDAGPEALAPGRPDAAKLAEELGVEMVTSAPGGPGAVKVGRRLREMPDGIGGFIPRKIKPLATTRLFSPLGKVRMAFETVAPVRRDDADESLESFTSRRLGKQAYERLVEPVASGIFCGDPARLSLLATMPHLRRAELEHGGLVRAVLAERRAAKQEKRAGAPPRRPGMASPTTGMGGIVDAVVARLEADDAVEIRLGTAAVGLERDGGRYRVELSDGTAVMADGVILAAPTAASAAVLDRLGAHEAAALLSAMEVASTATVSLGFRADGMPDLDALLPAHGYLIAGPGRGPVCGVTRSSSKFPGRAPEGHELFRVTVRAPDSTPDDELLELARAELAATLGIRSEPVLSLVQRWNGVMPQYAVGHLERVAELEKALQPWPGVVVAGSGTHGLGIPDCVASAERAAAALAG
jgi:oxygen-dependent protoporphyrinogen oxidase